MTAVTTNALSGPVSRPGHRPVFFDVMRAELTKLRTVRSTYWTLIAVSFVTIAFAVIGTVVWTHQYATISATDKLKFEPIAFTLAGLFLAQLLVVRLGVRSMCSEYSTGMIRATFAATPQRRMVLWAKAASFTLVSFAVGIVSCLVAFVVGQAILSGKGLGVSLGDTGALQAILGGGLYLTGVGLLGLAFGVLIRHSVGAILALVGVLFLLPGLLQLVPASIRDHVAAYLPGNAGSVIYSQHQDHMLSPWAGMGVFALYVAVALFVARVVLERRDA